MFLFKAIAKLFRSIGYLLTGRTDKLRENLDRDPVVIKAKFERIVGAKGERINQFMEAMGTIVAQQEKRQLEKERLLGEIQKNEQLKNGAAALLKKRLGELKKEKSDITKEEAQQDVKYRELAAKFNDVGSTQAEQKKNLQNVEEAIVFGQKRIEELTIQLKQLKAEIEKIKAESAETIADVITSTQERELNKMLAGLAQGDTTSEELQEMRDMRAQLRGEAKVSRIAAGTENAAVEAELLAMAEASVSNKELEEMIGIDDFFESAPKEENTSAKDVREALPE